MAFGLANLTAAIRAPFVKRFNLMSNPAPIDYAYDNGFVQQWASADGTYTIPGVGVDSNNQPVMFGQAVSPMYQAISFAVANNGSLGDTPFFVADKAYTIMAISYTHKTAAAGTATTANVTKDSGSGAPGSGVAVMSSTFNIKGSNNVVQNATIARGAATLNPGDRLSFNVIGAGTITSYAAPVVTLYLSPGGKGAVARYYAHLNADIGNQVFVIANRDLYVQSVRAIYGTKFTSGVTVDVTNDTGTGVPGSGPSILSAAMAGDGTANRVITPTLTATAANLYLPAGNRLSAKFSATTSGADVCIEVIFQGLNNRQEVTFYVGPNAQQQVSQPFWISDGDYEVVDESCIYPTAAGGVATGGVEILKGTTTSGSGTLVATAFNLNSTVNVVQVGTMATLRNRLLSSGDKLSYQASSGAAQSLAGLAITCSLIKRS